MRVEIQLEGGRITIAVGGSSSAGTNGGGNAALLGNRGKKLQGGDVGSESGHSGGGVPGSGTLVIGPIVVDADCTGSGGLGGDVGSDTGHSGGGVPSLTGGDVGSDTGHSGGGEPQPCCVTVIGPIVISCCGGGTAASTLPATSFEEDPPE